MTDGELLSAVLAHDEQAWRELVRRFRGLIYRCIGRVLAKYESTLTSEDIDEVFSEVCFNLVRDEMKKLRAYDPGRGTKLSSWIGLLSINTAYDHLRGVARRPLLDRIEGCPDREDGRPDALDIVLERERSAHLCRLASDLSAKDRRFVDLYFNRGLPPEQVARDLEISIKTVYSKKNKIRNRLLSLAQNDRLAA
jgi:RNA polymerase sigma-70 factor (ECF subfamily)